METFWNPWEFFVETSIFRPKPVPISLVGTLVYLEVRYQLFGAEK